MRACGEKGRRYPNFRFYKPLFPDKPNDRARFFVLEVGFGRKKGEVESDEEGMEIMEDLGKNVAWLIKKLKT